MNHKHYFVSYVCPNEYGRIQVNINSIKFDMDTIVSIEKFICDNYQKNSIVLNIIPLDCDCEDVKDFKDES